MSVLAGIAAKGLTNWLANRKAQKDADRASQIKRAAVGLGDKYKWLQIITFTMFTGVFVLAYVAPVESKLFWQSLDTIPGWIVEIYVYMVMAIWGYSVAQKGIMQTINALQKWHRNIKRKS